MLRQVEVSTDKGRFNAPASPVFDEIPNLAVTMTTFGFFEVTHVKTGLRLAGNYERYANAACAMARIQMAFDELGIDSGCDKDEFLSQYNDKNKPCETLGGVHLAQWLNMNNQGLDIAGEFPWETDEDCPHTRFDELLKDIGN